MFNSLSESIQSLPSPTESVKKEIINYSLKHSSAKKLKKSARRADLLIGVKNLKRDFLDTNAYPLDNFWKGVSSLYVPKCNNCHYVTACSKNGTPSPCKGFLPDLNKVQKKYKITDEDVDLAYRNLNRRDISFIGRRFRAIPEIPQVELNEIYRKLIKYTTYMVNTKLKFILNSHHEFETIDLVHDLVVEAHTRVLKCGTISDPLWLLNTMKQTVKQRMSNDIKFYTAEKRNNLVKVKDAQYDKYGREVSKAEFALQVLDLDYKYGEDQEGSPITIGDLLGKPDTTAEDKEFIRKLKPTLPKNIRRFASIALGKSDKDFDTYIKINFPDRIMNFDSLMREAKKFLGIGARELTILKNNMDFLSNM